MTANNPDNRYARSVQLLQKAERVIPLGSQTFSKSRTQFPPGAAPLFLERGRVVMSGTSMATSTWT